MEKKEMLYEGKAKKVYKTDDENYYIVDYKDDATAFNGKKKGTIASKGVINNRLSNYLMQLIEEKGIPTHFVSQLSDRETLVKKVSIIPLEVIVRNVAAGSLAERLGLSEGVKMKRPVIEYSYKSDELNDPMVNDYHILAMDFASEAELKTIADYALKINDILLKRFDEANLELIDFKIEFGKTPDGKVILADEISPDTCRLWDKATHEKLDKDRFRRDLGGVEDAYKEVLKRITGEK